jgi:hypothetical protein
MVQIKTAQSQVSLDLQRYARLQEDADNLCIAVSSNSQGIEAQFENIHQYFGVVDCLYLTFIKRCTDKDAVLVNNARTNAKKYLKSCSVVTSGFDGSPGYRLHPKVVGALQKYHSEVSWIIQKATNTLQHIDETTTEQNGGCDYE